MIIAEKVKINKIPVIKGLRYNQQNLECRQKYVTLFEIGQSENEVYVFD